MSDTREALSNDDRRIENCSRSLVAIGTANDFTAGTDSDESMPPLPRPLPDAVTEMAARLLVAPESAGTTGQPVVAGYEILAPLGRGGMGVVYRARHTQSVRIVALKLIVGGAHARSRDLARFRSEAEAVSQLEHANIVRLFEAGQHEGWSYFALEFVPGGSLGRQLAGRPQPANVSAETVQAVAQAMAYAHQHGIVHRDLKPTNILLTTDGIPKVADFGLAKRIDLEPGNLPSVGCTQTGEVLGTPNYMAPEQTLGRPDKIGAATDIYALGAVLYECLTGRPPFQGATLLDTLLQVRNDDPVPPRRFVPTVPRDLETVCLKCLEKEPSKRYASAAALAEDLHRFLAGNPVQARRPSAWELMVRWARRRKATAAVLGIIAIATLAVITLGVWHQVKLGYYNAELRAERDAADQLRQQAQAKEMEAQQQKEETEAHFRSALSAVNQMLVRVSEDDDRLALEPRMELVRRNLLEDALRFYQGFLKQRPNDPEVRRETAITFFRVGDIRKRLGQQNSSEEAYRAAIELFDRLASELPQRPIHRHDLAGCYTNLGSLLANTPRLDDAERAFSCAREIQQKLVDEFPTSREYRSALAGTDHNLATFLAFTRRLPDAEQALNRALEQRQRLVQEYPQVALYRRDLARTYYNISRILDLGGRATDAEPAVRQALLIQRQLVEEFPRDPSYRQELAGSHNSLANVLDNTKRSADGQSEYAKAQEILLRLVEEFPRVLAYRQDLAHSHHNLALILERDRPLEAEQEYRRALVLQKQLVENSPGVPTQLNELGRTYANLADLLLRFGKLTEARELGERAVQNQQAALKLVPRQQAYRRALGQHYRVLAEALLRLGDHAAAAKVATEMGQNTPSDQRMERSAASILARCISMAERDSTLTKETKTTLVQSYGDQAMAHARKAFKSGFRQSFDQLKSDPDLAPLRPRADFQKLIKDLEDAANTADK